MAIRHRAVSETVSSAQTEQPHTNGKVNGSASNGSQLSEADNLMRQMGSKKGFDPIPPDQYLHFLNDRVPLQRMLAYVRAGTIRRGRRSPYCVDEHGQPLTLEQMAATFGWTIGHARKTWAEGEQRGLVRMDDKGRLYLCGSVPLPPPPEAESDDQENPVQDFPEYLSVQIKQLSKSQLARFEKCYPKFCDLEDRITKDAMALARDLIQKQIAAKFFAQFGLKPRENKKRRETAGQEIVQVSLNELPEEFAQIFDDSVQTENSTLYNAKNGSVQNPHLLVTTEDRDTEKKNGRGELFSVAPEPNKKTAPPPQPSSAIAVPEPEREQAWEAFRFIMDACGKPISVVRFADCRAEFFKYPLPAQQHIVEDAAIRADEIWNAPKWTPDPLEYLRSKVWETKPVKRRSLPSATSQQQQKNAAFERLRARAQARDREREANS